MGESMGSDRGYVVTRSSAELGPLAKRSPLLRALTIELTERCNNDCIHCCINLPEDDLCARRRELALDEWQGILRQAADLGVLSLRITGGEPLLRDDFADVYLYARRLGMRVTLSTNARCITPKIADLLVRVPPLVGVEVSVYGMRRESYDGVTRRPGSYAGFQRGLALLAERSIRVLVRSSVLPQNRAELDDFEAWAATLPDMRNPPLLGWQYQLRSRRDSKARNRIIQRLRLSPKEGLQLLLRHEETYRQSMAEFCAKFLRPPGDTLFQCGAGRMGVVVDAYGAMQPCMTLRDPKLVHDLRTGTMREAMQQVFPRLSDIRAENPEYLARCARCFLKGLCEQCPAMAWVEHGELDTPVEYHCRVAHAQAVYLGLLSEGERAWEVSDWEERVRISVKEVGKA